MKKIKAVNSSLIKTKVGLITQDWNIVSIGEVIELSQYGLSISNDENGTIPIIGMKHLVDGDVKIDDLSYVSITKEESKKFCLKKGDILLNRTNSYELVGKISLFNHDNKLIVFASYLVRFQFDKNKVLPEFVNYFLNSYPAQHYLKRLATKAVSQANINPSVFRKLFLLPIPPLEEQKKIAEILSTWDKAIALTEKLITAKQKLNKWLNLALLNALNPIVLNKSWKNVKIGEICELHYGKGFKKEEYTLNGQSKIIGTTGIIGYTNKVLAVGETIIIGRKGTLNQPYYIERKEKFWAIDTTYYVSSNENMKFLYYLFKHINLLKFNESTGVPSLNRNSFYSIKVKIPDLKTQKIIVYFLDVSVAEIKQLEKLKEKIKKQKSGLMQKLLTGEWQINTEETEG